MQKLKKIASRAKILGKKNNAFLKVFAEFTAIISLFYNCGINRQQQIRNCITDLNGFPGSLWTEQLNTNKAIGKWFVNSKFSLQYEAIEGLSTYKTQLESLKVTLYKNGCNGAHEEEEIENHLKQVTELRNHLKNNDRDNSNLDKFSIEARKLINYPPYYESCCTPLEDRIKKNILQFFKP